MLMKTRQFRTGGRWPHVLALLCSGILTAGATADSLGPNIIEDDDDAANVPSEAKKAKSGGGQILTLAGSLDGEGGGFAARGAEGDYQDLWLIYIDNPAEFSASTVPGSGSATFDSRLFLFRPDGRGLLYANDSQGTLQTFLGNEATTGDLKLDKPGIYCLGIAGNPVEARTALNEPMFPPANGDQTAAPTAAGLSSPVTGWDPFVGGTGEYVIRLNGVSGIPFACGEGGDCYRANPGPGCNDLECCTIVGAMDPFCVDNVWDLQCANLARMKCVSCGAPDTGDCDTVHPTPFCADGECCSQVCAVDPTCCYDAWDAGCVSIAGETCTAPCNPDCREDFNDDGVKDGADLGVLLASWGLKGCTDLDRNGATDGADLGLFLGAPPCRRCGTLKSGGCLVPNNSPGCNEAECCEDVCELDPVCCQETWDGLCVTLAKENCAPTCGQENAGDCLIAHPSPGCSDSECCTDVCNVLPRCCIDFWDQTCVDYANSVPSCQP